MVSNPEKEIRFTRSGQARTFAIVGAIFVAIAATLFFTAVIGTGSPIHPLYPLPFLLPAAGAFWLSFRCAKHAFIILSPVGIEFFPFFKPSQNFRLWSWSEFHHAEVIGKNFYLHFNEEETGGAVISLSPMAENARQLLDVAIEGRMDERFKDQEEEMEEIELER
ncbi:MAG: hypothetical protein ACSHYB_02130 [Roseibacillus sp.]